MRGGAPQDQQPGSRQMRDGSVMQWEHVALGGSGALRNQTTTPMGDTMAREGILGELCRELKSITSPLPNLTKPLILSP